MNAVRAGKMTTCNRENKVRCVNPSKPTATLSRPVLQRLQNERGRGSQRGEPQHAGDEQQRDLAHLPAADRRLTHRLTEHPVPQRAHRVDLNQRHSQSGQSMQDALVKGVMHAGNSGYAHTDGWHRPDLLRTEWIFLNRSAAQDEKRIRANRVFVRTSVPASSRARERPFF